MKQKQIPKIFRLNGNEKEKACWLTHFENDFCMGNSKHIQSSLRYRIYQAIKSKMICIYHVLFLHYVSFSNYHNHAYYWLALEDCNESEFDERV